MKRLLFRLILGLVILLIAVGVFGFLWIDVIAKAGIEEGGTYALGVETRVETVSLSPFRGTMGMKGLRVANPEGFDSPHLMRSGKFDLEMIPGSLMDDTIVVKRFELDGLSLHVEQKVPKSNVSVILENLKRLGEEESGQPESGEGKKLQVGRVTIRNVEATFHLPAISPLEVKVPEIELANVTGDSVEGVVVSELIARLVPAILAAVLDKAQGVVSPDVLRTLNGDLSTVTRALGGQAEELVRNVHAEMQKVVGKGGAGTLANEVGRALGVDPNSPGRQVGKTVSRALEGLAGEGKTPEMDANALAPTKKEPSGLLDGLLGGKKTDSRAR